jgi:phosphopantothenoylcysteine decarboxylase/phosphopantothenate--cysteine ligase
MSSGDPVGLQRVPNAKVVEHRDGTLVIGADGRVHRFPSESGALVAELLRLLERPRSRDELIARLKERFEDVAQNAQTIDAAIEHLVNAGALAAPHPVQPARRGPERKLVLGITGAVGSAMAPQLASVLVGAGFRVRVALTKAARRFVTPLALESITHEPVVRGLWDRSKELPAPHINLAEWADAVLVCPATATTISRIARGDCSDLVSATAIATRAPVIVVPSMNAAMYEAPSVRRNVEQLRDDGFHLVMPGVGVEVAHAPKARVPVMGPAPAPREVLTLLETVLALSSVPRSAQMEEWDDHFRSWKPEEMPWHAEALDGDVVDALSVLPKPVSVLDIGTGLGTAARELAKRGLKVTATDISSVALGRAQGVVAGLGVTLVHDDITRSRLEGPFPLVVDRAVLHLLPADQQAAWLASVTRLTAPGGHLMVKVHADGEARFATTKFSAESLEKLLHPAFETVRISESTLPGTVSPPPRALLGVFRRSG